MQILQRYINHEAIQDATRQVEAKEKQECARLQVSLISHLLASMPYAQV